MNTEKAFSVYLRIWRAIAIYALFVAVTGIGTFLFILFGYAVTDRPLRATLDADMFQYPFIVQSVIIVLFLGSLIRTFAEHDTAMKEEIYPGAEAVGGLRENLRLVLSCRHFRIELATLALLPLLLPLECGFYPLTFLLFHGSTLSRAVQKLILLCIVLPILFVTSLWQHVSALYTWQEAELAQRPDNSRRILAPVLSTCALYLVCLLLLPGIISILLSALFSLAAVSFSLVGAVIAAVILLGFLLRYIRALCIRRTFFKNLRQRCEKCEFSLSRIKRPYRSIFRIKNEISFTVKAHDKLYSCKLLAGLARGNPMSFSPNGTVHVIHSFGLRILPARGLYNHTVFHAPDGRSDQMLHAAGWYQRLEIFRFTTKTDFTFEGDGQKVLIVNPVPVALFAGTDKSSRSIDNGEAVGEYRIFTGSAFLNALERDCVEKQ